MKRCPECRRDYHDDSLLYCLEDGAALLQGSVPSPDEPQTAILHDSSPKLDAATQPQIHTTERTAVLESKSREIRRPFDNRLLAATVLLIMIALGGYGAYRYLRPSSSGSINSIAVLPFENKSSDADTDYLSDGLAESLIFRLTQLPDLKVSPASSVMRYRGKEIDVSKIAAELGVDAVMTGRLMKRGDNLNITVELVDARNNKSLWGEQYQRNMSDLLATQREIATTVADKLQLKLSPSEKGLAKKYTNSNEAYQLYLKGRFLWNQRTKTSLKQAVEFYQQAVEKDPSFALAYSGLAETYVLFGNYEVAPPAAALPLAKAAVSRALELDDTLASAHAASGLYLTHDFEWDRAVAEFNKAIELEPNYATAHQWLAQTYQRIGRTNEARAEIQRAQALDPLSPIIRTNVGLFEFQNRHYDEAIAHLNETLSLQPDFSVALKGVCWAYDAKHDYQAAAPACRRAYEIGSWSFDKGHLIFALSRSGQQEEAKKLLQELKTTSENEYVPASAFAVAYLGLNQKDEALRMLEKDFDDHGFWIGSLASWPLMDELRSEPRFKQLLRKMNLPETE